MENNQNIHLNEELKTAGITPASTEYSDTKETTVKAKQKSKLSNYKWLVALISVLLVTTIIGVITFFASGASSLIGGEIAVIDVSGEIGSNSPRATYNHEWTLETIEDLIDKSSNKALIVRVNTPGGSVYTSDELYQELLKYKLKTKRPIYVYFQDQAASGGYYISMAADKIYANRNTWTGSIGVTVGTMYDISNLLERLGIKTNTITSGRNKAMGSIANELTEEQKAIMKSLVDESYGQFVGIVSKGRKLSKDKVREIGDGRIYSAKQALSLGLIDGICSEEAFYEKMQKEAHLEEATIKYYEPEKTTSLLSLLESSLSIMRKESELNNYKELMELSENGNKLSIKYEADIQK